MGDPEKGASPGYQALLPTTAAETPVASPRSDAPSEQRALRTLPLDRSYSSYSELPNNLEQISALSEDDPLPVTLLGFTNQVQTKDQHGNAIFGTEQDIGEDAWAAAVVAVVRDLTVIGMKRQNNMPIALNITRLACSGFVVVINFLLQIALLVFIHLYLVEPAVRRVQLLYHHFLSQVFDADGNILENGWEDYGRKDEICDLAMLNRYFYYALLLIWVLTGLQEVRMVQRMMANIWSMPSCHKNADMLDFLETNSFSWGGKVHIRALTPLVRWTVLLSICLPRGLIAVFLSSLGCRWLSASNKFSNMILNSLALAFVIHIDDLLYHSILPVATRKQISDTKLFYQDGTKPKSVRQVEQSQWLGYYRSAFYMFLAVVLLVLYGEVFQTVLPANMGFLQRMCHEHNFLSRQVICNTPALFDHSVCYPAGHFANVA
eukprot:gb/GFBE01083604.1/.p1 GENE.gb/GFBE01083604.1/~~gb/GFBE01083604.1/.p1  ORF type:complete len:434 (+),score=65.04 gb/GFBE01083604.1/:1-1302(+)